MNDQNKFEEKVEQVLQASLAEQKRKGPKLRQLHPKPHGLLKGKFIIDKDIPEYCKVGVFTETQEYEVWVRFSNGSSPQDDGTLQADYEPDARGAAIKLNSVKGESVLSDETGTQDFILLNHKIFFLPDVQGYLDLGKFKQLSKKQKEGNFLSPESLQELKDLAQKLEPSLTIVNEINQKVVGNPLKIEYFSTVPYKLGDQFIKYSLKPHDLEVSPSILLDSPNYLREAMVKHLTEENKSATFDFLVHFFEDESKTPIENPMVEWQEPWIKLATLEILPQEFDTPERKKQDEELSFNPWHTLIEHEPVGSINLARRRIYQEGAKARRDNR